jgi:molybdopterin converting factor small subunit
MWVVTIELYGVARLRAGRDLVSVEAASLGEAFRALAVACPTLEPTVVAAGRLQPQYIVAVNGIQFTADPKTPIADGDALVLISADAGG